MGHGPEHRLAFKDGPEIGESVVTVLGEKPRCGIAHKSVTAVSTKLTIDCIEGQCSRSQLLEFVERTP